MSWATDSLTMLRVMLNDAGVTQTYTDERLTDLLITAAYIIRIDVNFNTSYSVNINSKTVTPEPSEQSDGDEFTSFSVLKAACLMDESAFRTAALLQGVSARCGPASITTSNYGALLKELLSSGPCLMYDTLTNSYNFSYEGKKIIKAVMSPFAANDFDPGTQMGQLGIGDYQNPHRQRY